MTGKGIILIAVMCFTVMNSATLGLASIVGTASTTSAAKQTNPKEIHYISGNIKDTKGNALENAFVIPSQDGKLIGKGTYTDQKGTYTLTQLNPGKYNLIVVTIPTQVTPYSKPQGNTQLQEVHMGNQNIKGLDIVVTE